MRLRSLPDILLALAVTCTVTLVAAGVAAADDDRTSRRSAEMALPDSYLDPSWPDEAGEEMDGRYAPGKSDSVEEVPLGDEREIQEELRALQDPSGDTLPASGKAVTAPGGAVIAPGAATAAGNGIVTAPMDADPDGPQDDVEEAPDPDQRDPVEW